MISVVDRAREFVLLNGRLVDRYRFAAAFDAGDNEPVVRALRAYQNEDGGFGNGIEPDIRGASSQPVGAEQALRILDEVGHFDSDIVDRLCEWCAGASTVEGGLPFALESIVDGPRAPWWQPSTGASLNPTAAIAGLLHRAGVEHDWVTTADAFCWSALADRVPELTEHEALCALEFLQTPSDTASADRIVGSLRSRVLGDLVTNDPQTTGYVMSPLKFAPTPQHLARSWFDDSLIEDHLDALHKAQASDGGWPISWEPPSGVAASEWRGKITIDSLLVLGSYNRL